MENCDDYEKFEKNCTAWGKLGITVKVHKIKAYCKSCKKWTWVVQRKSYSGFVCQCTCGIIHATKDTIRTSGGYQCCERHFEDIKELGKHFNLEYCE